MKKYLNKKYSDLHWNSYNRLELIVKHIKQLNEDDLKYWEYLPEFMQKDYKIRAGIEKQPN